MSATDLERVQEIAASLEHAPRWPAGAYVAAIDPERLPRRIALVAEKDEGGGVVGFLVASMVTPEAELETIAVARDAQRQGVGGNLMAALAVELKVGAVTTLNLEVRASNRAAIGLYSRLGFEENGRRVRYYADPPEDAVLMRWKLERAGGRLNA